MQKRLWGWILPSLIALAACTSGSTYRRLVEIDSLTENGKADSAQMLLQGMQKDMQKASEGDRAYYDLLCIKADDKKLIPHTSDSTILSVIEYLENDDSQQHLAQAYYYAGRVYADMVKGEKALFYLQLALLADSTQITPYLRSRIYAQSGYVYLRNQLFEEALNMQQTAHYYCQLCGDTLGMRYSEEDIHTITQLIDTLGTNVNPAKVQRIRYLNERVRSHLLQRNNQNLEQTAHSSKWLSYLVLAVAVALAIGINVWLIRRKHQQAHPGTEKNILEPTRRQFFDNEISEMLAGRLKADKVLSSADWKLVEERLLQAFPTFRSTLFSHYAMSDTEYRICMLIKMQISPSNMARLMAMRASSISQSRLRMQQKVFDGQGTAKDWDIYVLSI